MYRIFLMYKNELTENSESEMKILRDSWGTRKGSNSQDSKYMVVAFISVH